MGGAVPGGAALPISCVGVWFLFHLICVPIPIAAPREHRILSMTCYFVRSFLFLVYVFFACVAMAIVPSRRGPWESGVSKQGVQLVDRSELCMGDGSNILSCGSFCASTLHEGSRGVTFLVFATLKKSVALRTQSACAGILNGFQHDRCLQLGIPKDRVEQVVLTLVDETAQLTEPRACTVVNFAHSSALFIKKSADIIEIELAEEEKTTFAFEMRKGDSDPQE